MANFTTNENLYKWSPTDTKTETITETAKNADKIDAKFVEVDNALGVNATDITNLETEKTDKTGDHLGTWHGLTPESKASVTYVNELAGINPFSTAPTFTNGVLTKVEELDGVIVKKRTTIAYNADGTVNTVTDVTEGKTVVSTMNYVNGVFASVTNQLIEGGL